MFIKLLKSILGKQGYEVIGQNELRLKEKTLSSVYRLQKLWIPRAASCSCASGDIECVVFSKDRAMQLHALLMSFQNFVTPATPVYVLYSASSPNSKSAYSELITLFGKDAGIQFIEQQSDKTFRNDLIRVLNSIEVEKIFFLVDDIVFTEKVNIEEFSRFNSYSYVPSLRMGKNLSFCYTMNKDQTTPNLEEVNIGNNTYIRWQWDCGEFDWNYPLSVDGHIFDLEEIRDITKAIEFSAPNSYESALQEYRHLFLPRFGVAYKKSRLFNIPCNKVQSENENIFGDIHQDVLLGHWTSGKIINYRKYDGFNNISAHQEVELELFDK